MARFTSIGAEPSAHETGGTAITTRDWESSMDRRTVLKGLAGVGSLAATGGLSPPAGAEIPRRRAGAEQGCGGKPGALVGSRFHGADDQGDPERTDRGRRQDLQMGAEAALSEDDAGTGQEQYALRLHHAGAHRPDRPIQADPRLHRLRPNEV